MKSRDQTSVLLSVRTTDFYVFGHFYQKAKNEKWNELDIQLHGHLQELLPEKVDGSGMILEEFQFEFL